MKIDTLNPEKEIIKDDVDIFLNIGTYSKEIYIYVKLKNSWGLYQWVLLRSNLRWAAFTPRISKSK